MSDIIASPFSHELPYSALFFVPKRSAVARRPASYFWDKAIAPSAPAPAASNTDNALTMVQTASTWLDDDSSLMSEDETVIVMSSSLVPRPPQKRKSFARMRQIAYQVFVPKAGSNKSSTVVATEFVTKKKLSANDPLAKNGQTIFNSWRIKTKGANNTHVRKLAAVVRKRISSRSREDQKPKTWEEYDELYAAEQIDINDPPLPPTESCERQPTPFENKCYMPPNAYDELARQLVINRLGVFGKAPFDSSDIAVVLAQKRAELAEKLEREGRAPQTLEKAWEGGSSGTSAEMSLDASLATIQGDQSAELVPETLEQHPVFKNLVRKCRDMFGAAFSLLSIMDADRQTFLAQSGGGGLRELPRAGSFCTHTVLSGRKGFAVLDTLNDWRFSSNPVLLAYNARFYAGVPLMAPNLDGSLESDQASCVIGTLCVLDVNPRDSFGVEDRKKLVYLAEYARREIEVWFKLKVDQKVAALDVSHNCLVQEIRAVDGSEDELMGQQAEVLTDMLDTPLSPSALIRSGFRRFGSTSSLGSTASTTSLASESSKKPLAPLSPRGPSVFDDMSSAIKPKMLKVFEMVTKLVGETLDLSLVYLLAVTPNGGPSNTGRILVLCGHNLPSSATSFDTKLHLRTLRAPEGGLLYQNPSSQDVQDAALMPTSVDQVNLFASAMLVRVGPEPAADKGGFVMGGFTSNATRVFGAEDFTYMQQFANELTRYTLKLRL